MTTLIELTQKLAEIKSLITGKGNRDIDFHLYVTIDDKGAGQLNVRFGSSKGIYAQWNTPDEIIPALDRYIEDVFGDETP